MSKLKLILSLAAIAALAFDALGQGVSLDASLLPQAPVRACAVADGAAPQPVLAAR